MIKQIPLQTSLKYRLLTDHSEEIILFFNQSGKIIECNQRAIELLGYKEDIYQISITDIFRKAVKKEDNQLVVNEKYFNKLAETVAYRKNQTCFTVNLRITEHNGLKSFTGACIAIDLSGKKRVMHELKQVKNELKLSRQTKNEFVANISHELKTPVNGIMGLIDNLMETELTPSQLETVNIIHRCCLNMDTIINDLLDYTKIANNKLVLEQRKFNFRKFINNLVTFNINKINEKGLKFFVNVADDIPSMVVGDELRLTQILNNLISNAIKFTSIGQIALEVVKTEQTEQEVELFFMIMDTGIGISIEDKDKLFQSFSQVDGSITRRFGGTGLGLSISKLLVEAMHGTITVESEKNKGSNFSFSVHMGIPETAEETSSGENGGLSYNNLNIDGKTFGKKVSEPSGYQEIDYIGELLKKANISPVSLHNTGMNTEISAFGPSEKISKDIFEIMERLMICIEMGSWVKAEDFAAVIKTRIPEEFKELKNKALRLVLSVRKGEHDNSLLFLSELKDMVNEVNGWKI